MPSRTSPVGPPLGDRSWASVRATSDRRTRAAELTAEAMVLEGLVAAAEQSIQEADAAYTTEQSDVDSLEKRRLPLIGAAAKDRHEVALWTERGERDVAADVATRARATLAATEAQLHRVRLELDSLGDTETPFDMAVRAYAADAVGPHASDLRNANGEIAQTRRELARLDEALVGGYAALDVLDEADTLLRSAQFWGESQEFSNA